MATQSHGRVVVVHGKNEVGETSLAIASVADHSVTVWIPTPER